MRTDQLSQSRTTASETWTSKSVKRESVAVFGLARSCRPVSQFSMSTCFSSIPRAAT